MTMKWTSEKSHGSAYVIVSMSYGYTTYQLFLQHLLPTLPYRYVSLVILLEIINLTKAKPASLSSSTILSTWRQLLKTLPIFHPGSQKSSPSPLATSSDTSIPLLL